MNSSFAQVKMIPSDKVWGCYPHEWEEILKRFPHADLLPVVSNLERKISPKSKLKEIGKVPSGFDADGLVVGVPAWTQKRANDMQIERWRQNPDLGVCVQTREIRGLDCDIASSQEKATALRDLIDDWMFANLGTALPMRFRKNSSKFLMPFRLIGEFGKIRIDIGDGDFVEFLMNGQQFVAGGTHPSGARIEWEWIESDIPKLEKEHFDALVALIMGNYPEAKLISSDVSVRKEKKAKATEALHTAPDSFDPRVKLLVDKKLILDIGADGKLFINCPWKADHTSDNGPTQTAYFPAGVGGYERGHFHCFHAHCADKKDADFVEALGLNACQFEPLPAEYNCEESGGTPNPITKIDPERAAQGRTKLCFTRTNYGQIARAFSELHCRNAEGENTLIRANASWYEYIDGAYEILPPDNEVLRTRYRKFLEQHKCYVKVKKDEYEEVDFHPNKGDIDQGLDALAAEKFVRNAKTPSWLTNERRDPNDFVALENGIFHIPSRTRQDLTANFFSMNRLPFAWNGESEPKKWLSFLAEVFPDDQQSVDTLQEMFGYLLTPYIRYQKIFMLKGVPGSGKSTATGVLTELLGAKNVCAGDFGDFAQPFGLQPYVGKLVAIYSDEKLDARDNKSRIAKNLKRISGADAVPINIKFKSPVSVQLGCRVVLVANEAPEITDSSNALFERFIILDFKQRIRGTDQEDPDLPEKLLTELPGIFGWALEGRERLNKRGKFINPPSSEGARQDLERLNNPHKAFIEDRCEMRYDYRVGKDELYDRWVRWNQYEGRKEPGTRSRFCKIISELFPQIKTTREREGEQRRYVFEGIRLNDFQEIDEFNNAINAKL